MQAYANHIRSVSSKNYLKQQEINIPTDIKFSVLQETNSVLMLSFNYD